MKAPASIPPLLPHVSFGRATGPRDDLQFFAQGRQAMAFLARQLQARDSDTLYVLPAYTCETVVQAIASQGGDIWFVDVDDTLDFSLPDLEKTLKHHGQRTLVLVATSLFGAPVRDYKRMNERWTVVEDRAQTVLDAGSTADYQVLSFGPGKLISGFGGGALWGASAWRQAHAALPVLDGLWPFMAKSCLQEAVLRWGWRWVASRFEADAGKDADDLVSLNPMAMELQGLGRQRARWISHSMATVDVGRRRDLARLYASQLPREVLFDVPSDAAYLRYPVKRSIMAPGVSQGHMYAATWRAAQRQRGRDLPGAQALVRSSLLPMHELVTGDHVRCYRELLGQQT